MTYSREITKPANMEEGLQNFVQMIINRIEAGDAREALLLAVDLHQDLTSGIYKEATEVDLSKKPIPADEHFAAVKAAKAQGIKDGLERGRASMAAEIREKLAA